MSEKLPPFGFAEDILARLPEADPSDPEQIVRFVEAVAPPDRPEVEKPVTTLQFVTFSLHDELYALRVERVREVIRVQRITRVPQAPAHVRGVHNLRGAILPVLEVRTRLGLPPAEIGPRSRIVVAESRHRRIGLLVDAVQQVIRVPETAVEPPPPEVRHRLSEYVIGVVPAHGRLALLLSLDKLLVLPELAP